MMKFGKRLNFGDVIVAEVQFTDTFDIKRRPVSFYLKSMATSLLR